MDKRPSSSRNTPALLPRNNEGHQFVCYADCCSGIPGGRHEATFASVNQVVSRLHPQPEFICFPGDEIKGLVSDEHALKSQWRYWFEHEMSWLDRDATPLYHTTGNHTTYDALSEAVFRDVMSHLPQNGPIEQQGLSYFVRRDDLLMVFVNTMWSGLGDGRVETSWLDKTLAAHADARHKLVFGHHPAYPINGFSGDYQRNLDTKNRWDFWQILVRHGVIAYVCSHIMAFDVQVHEGVLQILTAGAGTLPLMPEDVEYLHCVQAALDQDGLRYQVLDTSAKVREWLWWPFTLPPSATWTPFVDDEVKMSPFVEEENAPRQRQLIAWHFDGRLPLLEPIQKGSASSPSFSSENAQLQNFSDKHLGGGEAQTLLCGWTKDVRIAPFWLGFQGPEQRLSLLLSAAPGRSPHYWLGPTYSPGERFSFQLAIHTGMGPGGFLWRADDSAPWSSLSGATPWGAERLLPLERWRVGSDQGGPTQRPFRGTDLTVKWYAQTLSFDELLDSACD